MAVTKGKDSDLKGPSGDGLGASLGLTDADLLAMYRMVALARAVDERMWILNRAGRIPFVSAGRAMRVRRSASCRPFGPATTGWSRSTGRSRRASRSG